ncbi:hypothetical protein [Rhizobium sp. 18055]|uniref:hypothetical protein n=1 Tax=Rhizobium sp. 18055 TaxID=2681403 RepID=UPI00135CF5E7|nr:hypothetical protein [Rhizobium sp. 18055]
MKKIAMTLTQVESWTAQYTGDRAGIQYDGEYLYFPDELLSTIQSIDTSPASQPYLEILKSRLKREIDQKAEIQRLRYITPGAGQAMTYQQKMEEVRALADDVGADAALYPLLAAEIGITAPSLSEVAAVVRSAYQQWQFVGAAIEAARLGTKAAIDAAPTQDEAQQAADSVLWP